jgi:protein-disulfide isomerase
VGYAVRKLRRRRTGRIVAGTVGGLFLATALSTEGWSPSTLQAQERVEFDSFGYTRGEPGAPVEVVEFADFGCSACAAFATGAWADFHREFVETGVVSWRFIPFILGSFRNSEDATTAAECVAELAPESYWSMHDILYARQENWNRRRRPEGELRSFAEELGVDGEAFEDCYDGGAAEDRIDRNNDLADDLGVRATPTFFVNGRTLLGAPPLSEWRTLIDAARAEQAVATPGPRVPAND